MRHDADFHRSSRTVRERAPVRRRVSRRAADGQRGGWGAVLLALVLGTGIGYVAAAPGELGRLRDVIPDLAAPSGMAPARTAEATVRGVRFGLCHSGGGTNCVVDGDTFWLKGERIRIADIDTPETHPPRCAKEARLGKAATLRLRALLNAGPVTLEIGERDVDRYGRKLRVVTREGKSLGDTLVAKGLARPWEGRRRGWCGAA